MFAICIESNHKRGLGHLYRSLILANNLRSKGYEVNFILNNSKFAYEEIRKEGFEFEVKEINQENDWEKDFLRSHPNIKVWINDRLNTKEHHSKLIKTLGLSLITFDDRGTGAKYTDLNIAALAYEEIRKYSGGKVLLGHKYLILDPILEKFRKIRKTKNKLIVTLGGSDTWGITPYVMTKLLELNQKATIILGPAFEHFDAVQKIQSISPKEFFKIKHNVPSLIKEMNSYQIAITSGGITPFQANAMGLPCVVIATESFEIEVGRYLEKLGCNTYGGFKKDLNVGSMQFKFPIKEYSRKALEKVDSKGIERVINNIIEFTS